MGSGEGPESRPSFGRGCGSTGPRGLDFLVSFLVMHFGVLLGSIFGVLLATGADPTRGRLNCFQAYFKGRLGGSTQGSGSKRKSIPGRPLISSIEVRGKPGEPLAKAKGSRLRTSMMRFFLFLLEGAFSRAGGNPACLFLGPCITRDTLS